MTIQPAKNTQPLLRRMLGRMATNSDEEMRPAADGDQAEVVMGRARSMIDELTRRRTGVEDQIRAMGPKRVRQELISRLHDQPLHSNDPQTMVLRRRHEALHALADHRDWLQSEIDRLQVEIEILTAEHNIGTSLRRVDSSAVEAASDHLNALSETLKEGRVERR